MVVTRRTPLAPVLNRDEERQWERRKHRLSFYGVGDDNGDDNESETKKSAAEENESLAAAALNLFAEVAEEVYVPLVQNDTDVVWV